MTETTAPLALGARLDRLPWSRRHSMIFFALGTGWLFDAVEVQLFSNAVGPLGDHYHATVFERDAVLAVWLSGILLGSLCGGWLTDRLGRRRMFVYTLLWYAGFTVLTGLSPDLGFVYALRFLAALGVGAEYPIVNSAIAELMPSRVRGRAAAGLICFWPIGSILAALLAYLLLNTLALSAAVSWRWMFVLGGILAFTVLFFRRRIPESPRWLAAHGRTAEAEQVVSEIERAAGVEPAVAPGIAPSDQVRHPTTLNALRELVRRHPGRLALGALLDLAEAFGYYGIYALLSVVVLAKVHINDAQIPFFFIVGNVGSLAGGLAAAWLLDRIGRRVTVTGGYLVASAGVGLLAAGTATGSGIWVTVTFVAANLLATIAWTSAYPAFSELFPTHLRGVGIGTSVAIGRIGAIVGTLSLPDLATHLGPTPSYLLIAAFWLVGALTMGVYAWRGGQEARGKALEALAPELEEV